jgi:hypothetical protein
VPRVEVVAAEVAIARSDPRPLEEGPCERVVSLSSPENKLLCWYVLIR